MIVHPQQIIKKIPGALLISMALLFLAQLAVSVFLPGYIESVLIPETAKKYGIDQASADILKLGLFETAVGPVRLGDREASFLDIASIKIRYTPWGLINRHIEKMTVSGVTVNAARRDGAFILPGFFPKPGTPVPAAEERKVNAPAMSWPVSIGAVEIDHATINLVLEDDLFQLPLALTLTPAGKEMNPIDGTLRFSPHGQEITVNARLDVAQGRLVARLEAPSVRLDSFADWTARFPGLSLSGKAALSAQADIAVKPLQVLSAAMDLSLPEGRFAYREVALGPVDENTPITIKAAGSGEKGWQLTGSAAALLTPVPLRISGFNCSVSPGSAPGIRQGTFAVALDRSAEQPDAAFYLLAPVAVEGDVQAEYPDGKSWRVTVTGRKSVSGPNDCLVKSGDITFKTPVPGFTFSAGGTGAQIRAEGMLSTPRAAIGVDSEEIVLLNGVIRGNADLSRTPDKGLDVAGGLQLSTGKISAVRQKAEISRIDIDFPFQWPERNRDQGKLAIGPLTWRDLNLGALTATLRQEGKGAHIKGQYAIGLLPGVKGDLTGRAGMDSDDIAMAMNFHLQRRSDAADIDLGRFLAEAAGTAVNADLDATVDVALNKGKLTGRLVARIDKGKVQVPDKAIAITGIRANLTVPDLFTVKSDPGKIFFKEAAFGDIHAADGEVAFQLESARTIFIEKGAFNWCRGSVYAEGMRITPDSDEYALTLYGDRLNLPDVLSQIGAIQAEGEGTVSGRIPIRYAHGDISINNGFLFSAPGEGGVIHLSKTDILTAGLPESSLQYSQIDLAREALKNYQYDWAKVLLNSEEENLHIRLEFDGRPTQSLPFVYDKEKGGFVRDTDNRTYSEFEGLSLDVNFRIPLNQLIGYKGRMKR